MIFTNIVLETVSSYFIAALPRTHEGFTGFEPGLSYISRIRVAKFPEKLFGCFGDVSGSLAVGLAGFNGSGGGMDGPYTVLVFVAVLTTSATS
jgi:hypothetical protein